MQVSPLGEFLLRVAALLAPAPQVRFASNIELLRKRRRFSLAKLAERSQIDGGKLTALLSGEHEASASEVYTIAGALGVDPGELFDGIAWVPPADGGSGFQIDGAPGG